MREEFEKILECDNDTLFKYATKIQTNLEHGQLETQEELENMSIMNPEEREKFHLQKLERAEGTLCLLLASIKDKVKMKELVKNFENNNRRKR